MKPKAHATRILELLERHGPERIAAHDPASGKRPLAVTVEKLRHDDKLRPVERARPRRPTG